MNDRIKLKKSTAFITMVAGALIVSIMETFLFNEIIIKKILDTTLNNFVDWTIITVFNFILILMVFLMVYATSCIEVKSKNEEGIESDIFLWFIIGGMLIGMILATSFNDPIILCYGIAGGLIIGAIVENYKEKNKNKRKTIKKSK